MEDPTVFLSFVPGYLTMHDEVRYVRRFVAILDWCIYVFREIDKATGQVYTWDSCFDVQNSRPRFRAPKGSLDQMSSNEDTRPS